MYESPLVFILTLQKKAELGRHAFEQRMPERIATLITNEATTNRLTNVVPILATVLAQDPEVERAYLCHPDTQQISKLKDEGNHFCAYRNIQMLLGPNERYPQTIPAIQAAVEKAWERGFNAHGRIETGGIEGTRKHIGTSEAQALLQSLSIPCEDRSFSGREAWRSLLDYAEGHCGADPAVHNGERICVTDKPPIFLQRPRHSLTIVGIEKLTKGKRRLLVFDPGYQPPSRVEKYSAGDKHRLPSRRDMKVYRRNERYIRMYSKFETLTRTETPKTT